MATVVNITKTALQTLVDQKKSIKEIAEHFSAPVAQIKAGIKKLGVVVPRASKGGVVFNFIDEEATFTQSEAPVSLPVNGSIYTDITPEEVEAAFKSFETNEAQEEVVLETADNTDF